jgi:hypothetical protein
MRPFFVDFAMMLPMSVGGVTRSTSVSKPVTAAPTFSRLSTGDCAYRRWFWMFESAQNLTDRFASYSPNPGLEQATSIRSRTAGPAPAAAPATQAPT